MKKNNKIVALLALSFVCAAAAVVNVNAESASASTPAVFEMVSGASIRVAKDGNPGIRFTVKLDETVKEKVENGATLGFVASYSNYFDGVTGNYVNTVTNRLALDKTTVEANKIYEEDGEYFASLAIVGEVVANNLDKEWAAVAYLTEDGETYTYTPTVEARTIQLVASRVYFAEASKWADTIATYANLGTEEMPLLVENGEYGEPNSYQNLIRKESSIGELKFKMTENVVAEREAEVGVIVNADEYTVSSPEGLIWDGAMAKENTLWISSDDGSTTGFTLSYDETKKFNGVGNGSAVLDVDVRDSGKNHSNVYFNVNALYTPDYYKALYAQGYTHLTVRFMIPNHGAGVQKGFSLLSALGWLSNTDNATCLYENGTVNTEKWYDHGMGQMGKWLEYSFPLKQEGVDKTQSGEDFVFNGFNATLQFFRINVFDTGKATIYVDNIYMTKSAGTSETIEATNGTELNLSESAFNYAGAVNPVLATTKNGEAITVGDTVTLDNGIYDFTFRAENRFGVAKTSYVAFDEKQVLWSYLSDPTLQNIYSSELYTNNTSTPSTTSTAELSDPGVGWYCARVTHSAEQSYSDLYVKPTQTKAYYEALKAAGYKYVTISMSFGGGSFKIAPVGGECNNVIHYNNFYVPGDIHKGFMTVEKAEDGTITETGFVTAAPWANGGTGYILSFDINLFINNYNANGMKIARLFTVWGNGNVKGWYNFNQMQFTKDGQIVA